MFVADIRWTDISTRSERVVDIWVLKNNRKMLISRVLFWNHLLVAARKINKQNDHTKFTLSIIVIVTWLFSKVSSYPEQDKSGTGQKNYIVAHICTMNLTTKSENLKVMLILNILSL